MAMAAGRAGQRQSRAQARAALRTNRNCFSTSTDSDAAPHKVHVHGATGRLGSLICEFPNAEALLHRSTAPLPVDEIQTVIDTSLPEGLESLVSRLQDGAEGGRCLTQLLVTLNI